MHYDTKSYPLRVWYSAEDKGFIAEVIDIPSLSAVGDTPEEAVREIGVALSAALELYAEQGELPPAPRNPAAAALGKLGGAARSRAKLLAVRANGAKGGRPKGSKDKGPRIKVASGSS